MLKNNNDSIKQTIEKHHNLKREFNKFILLFFFFSNFAAAEQWQELINNAKRNIAKFTWISSPELIPLNSEDSISIIDATEDFNSTSVTKLSKSHALKLFRTCQLIDKWTDEELSLKNVNTSSNKFNIPYLLSLINNTQVALRIDSISKVRKEYFVSSLNKKNDNWSDNELRLNYPSKKTIGKYQTKTSTILLNTAEYNDAILYLALSKSKYPDLSNAVYNTIAYLLSIKAAYLETIGLPEPSRDKKLGIAFSKINVCKNTYPIKADYSESEIDFHFKKLKPVFFGKKESNEYFFKNGCTNEEYVIRDAELTSLHRIKIKNRLFKSGFKIKGTKCQSYYLGERNVRNYNESNSTPINKKVVKELLNRCGKSGLHSFTSKRRESHSKFHHINEIENNWYIISLSKIKHSKKNSFLKLHSLIQLMLEALFLG